MGLFWDLIQQSQISDQNARATSLEVRVVQLERELAQTRASMRDLLSLLEQHFGQDIDKDGRIG